MIIIIIVMIITTRTIKSILWSCNWVNIVCLLDLEEFVALSINREGATVRTAIKLSPQGAGELGRGCGGPGEGSNGRYWSRVVVWVRRRMVPFYSYKWGQSTSFFSVYPGYLYAHLPIKAKFGLKDPLGNDDGGTGVGSSKFLEVMLGYGLEVGWGGGKLVWGYAGVWARDGVGGRLAYGGSAVACARGGVVDKLAWGDKRNVASDACIRNGKMVLPCRVTEHLPHVLYSVASPSYS